MSGNPYGGVGASQPSNEPPPPPAEDGRVGPIGVPEFMRGPDGVDVPWASVTTPEPDGVERRFGVTPPSRVQEPRYWDGDEKSPSKFGIRNAEDRARVQMALEDAGELKPGSYAVGEWGKATWDAFREVLAFSNVNGTTWSTGLQRMAQATAAAEAEDQTIEPGYLAPTRLEPDPAKMRQGIKSFAEQTIGRDLQDDEVDYLQTALGDIEKGDYQRYADVHRSEYDAQVHAAESGEDHPAATGEEYGPEVTASRFRELFEERYAPEIKRGEEIEVGQSIQQLLRQGGSMAGSMMGGR